MDLMHRAIELCEKLNIDPDKVVEVRNLRYDFKGMSFVGGTVVKYFKGIYPTYAVLTPGGWTRSWTWTGGKVDLVRILRSMKTYGFSPTQMGQILGMSASELSKYIPKD